MRLLPLVPLMLWLSWSDRPAAVAATSNTGPLDLAGPMALLGLVMAIVMAMAVWARRLARHPGYGPLPTRRFQLGLTASRAAIVAGYAVLLFIGGFGAWVDSILAPIGRWNTRLPGVLIGTAPVLLGWVGLWWAAYPVDRAIREQNLLTELDRGLNVHATPSLRETLLSNFRMQVLFLLAPILATVAIRDLFAIGFSIAGTRIGEGLEAVLFVTSVGAVFLLSPELLIRVLRARPLAPSPLRDRLERMADQLGLQYRDILVWHTSYGIGNAAVMGLIPRFRYVLLTDLLIETLNDRQIEAVFAHEAGHVQHRHLLWYVVFFAIFVLSMAGPGEAVLRELSRIDAMRAVPSDLVVFVAFAALFLALFGMLARLFERQADIYAARSVESLRAIDANRSIMTADALLLSPAQAVAAPMRTPVGSVGAESFVSALVRVAEINHMPIVDIAQTAAARRNPLSAAVAQVVDVTMNFLHPSIPVRVKHLRTIAGEPSRTEHFDRKVATVMFGMIVALMTLAAWVGVSYLRPQPTASTMTDVQYIEFDEPIFDVQ